ncbi:MAG: DUF2911 domain-containing protein [Chthoniobacterales bacterium]
MKFARISFLLLPLLLSAVSPLVGQEKPARVSPLDTVTQTIGGNEIKVVYSRPFTKDPKTGEMRKIWGGLVPFGQLWRTGANEATVLSTQQPLKMGDKTIPVGSYSLFTIPTAEGGKMIVNKQTGQSGLKRDEAEDLAQVDMKKEPLSPAVDQFTIGIDKAGDTGGVLKLMWQDAQYTVPFTVSK